MQYNVKKVDITKEVQVPPKGDEIFFEFEKGSRSTIHPLFEEIEDFDIRMLYNKKDKFFLVEFSPSIENGKKKYNRGIISKDVKYIINSVRKLQEAPLK